jgi:hypothetical protein
MQARRKKQLGSFIHAGLASRGPYGNSDATPKFHQSIEWTSSTQYTPAHRETLSCCK